jgi:hypothetical protein
MRWGEFNMRRRSLLVASTVVVVLGVAMQLVPVDRPAPPSGSEIPAPPEVRAVLQRACYDCHSSHTEWPWYSRVAPVSWLVASDVREGTAEVNYSAWDRYTAAEQAKKLAKSRKEVDKGKMPLWFYVAIHRNARLSPADVALIDAWAGALPSPTPKPTRPPA